MYLILNGLNLEHYQNENIEYAIAILHYFHKKYLLYIIANLNYLKDDLKVQN